MRIIQGNVLAASVFLDHFRKFFDLPVTFVLFQNRRKDEGTCGNYSTIGYCKCENRTPKNIKTTDRKCYGSAIFFNQEACTNPDNVLYQTCVLVFDSVLLLHLPLVCSCHLVAMLLVSAFKILVVKSIQDLDFVFITNPVFTAGPVYNDEDS